MQVEILKIKTIKNQILKVGQKVGISSEGARWLEVCNFDLISDFYTINKIEIIDGHYTIFLKGINIGLFLVEIEILEGV